MAKAKVEKVYTIIHSRYGKSDIKHTGTLPELVEMFSYTLEVGQSWEHEKGNKKINMNPKNIQSLVTNVYNAKNNAAQNGYSGSSFSFVEGAA